MARKSSPKRGAATPESKKMTKAQAKPPNPPATKSTPRATAKEKKATKAAPRVKALSKRMLEDAIMAVLSSRLSVTSPRLNQIEANLEHRLKREVPRAQLIGVLTALETDGKLIRHYLSDAAVVTAREEPRKMISPPACSKAMKISRPVMPMTAALADDTAADSADDDDFNLKDGVRVVLCNPPQGPLFPSQVLQRLNDFFGITFSQIPVTDALEDLAALPTGDPKRIDKSPEGRFSRQCL